MTSSTLSTNYTQLCHTLSSAHYIFSYYLLFLHICCPISAICYFLITLPSVVRQDHHGYGILKGNGRRKPRYLRSIFVVSRAVVVTCCWLWRSWPSLLCQARLTPIVSLRHVLPTTARGGAWETLPRGHVYTLYSRDAGRRTNKTTGAWHRKHNIIKEENKVDSH